MVFGRDGLQVSTGIFTQIWCMVETNTVYTAAAAFMKIGFTVRQSVYSWNSQSVCNLYRAYAYY